MNPDTLLRRMTLAEKIGQLNLPNARGPDATGAAAAVDDLEQRIRRGEVGFLSAGIAAPRLREWQRIACEESPHGIPLLFTFDVIHGHRTVFPLPIGLAGTFDIDLIARTARAAAVEAAADGIALAWAPMIDVARDARWGRCAESPGEDPVLASAYARAMVRGLQADDLSRFDAVMACAKHFAGYGLAESGRDYNGVDATPYRLHNVVLPPFRAALAAGVGAIMVGFHDLAGIPCTAHRALLRDLLRDKWGFDGLVVSDYTAILELVHHGVAIDLADAARLAFTAGVDVDMVSEAYVRHLPALVAAGHVTEEAVDAACRRVLAAKQRLGLFAEPYRGLDAARRTAPRSSLAHRPLAREAAAQACVLLKNDGVLPLARTGCAIALVGPLADSRVNMQGTWAVAADAADSVTVLEGVRAALGPAGVLRYARGANISDNPWEAARVGLFDPVPEHDARGRSELIAEAVACAQTADVVVACVGEAKEHSGESATRTELGVPGAQHALLVALRATGRPLVVVTMSGRPLALEWADTNANAVLHTWFGGSEAGRAIADVLFGAVNPSGRLAMSFPRNAGQCPVHYAEPPTGRPRDGIGLDVPGDGETDALGRRVFRKFTTACRLEGPHTALYPFGFGLGYSPFEYGVPRADKTVLRGAADRLTFEVEVRNCGTLSGVEVVQLYIGDPVAERSRPVRELKAFRRIALEAGESARVAFTITIDDLGYSRAEHLADPAHGWEPGVFDIAVGPNSAAVQSVRIEWLAD